jgi:transposase
MAKKSAILPPIPAETASVAGLVYEEDNGFLALGRHHRSLFADVDLSALYGLGEHITTPLPIMALVTVFQYVEQLSDDEAVEAVRTRIDWEFALHLPLDSPDIDLLELIDFHRRLSRGSSSCGDFDLVLDRVHRLTPLWPWPSRTPHTSAVTASLQVLNSLPVAIKALWLALEALRSEAPDWVGHLDWLDGRHTRSYGWLHLPSDPGERESLARTVAAEGYRLLAEAERDDTPETVSSLPELSMLDEVWRWKFADGGAAMSTTARSGTPPAVGDSG